LGGAQGNREVRLAGAQIGVLAGLEHPHEFRPEHFSRRVSVHESMTFAELYPSLKRSELLTGAHDKRWREMWDMARADSFAPAAP
jgi:hypothetical protein